MSKRQFTIEMLDMDLADLDTDGSWLNANLYQKYSLELRVLQARRRAIEALQIVRDDLDDVLKGTHLEGDGYRHYGKRSCHYENRNSETTPPSEVTKLTEMAPRKRKLKKWTTRVTTKLSHCEHRFVER